jgi:hypothetical protein
VAQSSSKLLNEVGTSINGYISRGEEIPKHILASSFEQLHKVLQNLLTIVQPKQ